MDTRKISQIGSETNTEPTKDTSNINTPSQPQSPKVKTEVKTSTKPLVEGINAPKTFSDVTSVKRAPLSEQEMQLISETESLKTEAPKQNLMPDSVINRGNKNSRSLEGWIIAAAILIILGVFGYKFYSWKAQKPVAPEVQNNSTNASPSAIPIEPEPSNTTSTLQNLASPVPPQSTTTTPATSTPEATTPVMTAGKILKINATPTGYLNVRDQASSAGKVIAKVHPAETYAYTSTKPGWYLITISDKISGWVSAQYVSVSK